jgi:hypothetical protein
MALHLMFLCINELASRPIIAEQSNLLRNSAASISERANEKLIFTPAYGESQERL